MLLLVFALLLSESPKKPVVDAADLKKLAGSWAIISQEHGGTKTPMKELASLSMEAKGEKMTVRDGNEVIQEATIVRLDPKAKPAVLDVKITAGTDKDKEVKGLYKLEDDKLTICVGEPGKDRPKDFAANKGDGQTIIVFLRQKKK